MYPHKKKVEKETKISVNIKPDAMILNKQVVGDKEVQSIEIARYYVEKKNQEVINEGKAICDNSTGFMNSRPQLGTLPSFIPFQ